MDKKNFRSIDVVPTKLEANLTQEDMRAFEINDAIFDIHHEFNTRTLAAETLTDLSGILSEFVGSKLDMTDGLFYYLLDDIANIQNDAASIILTQSYNDQQQISESLFQKRIEEIKQPSKKMAN